MKKGKIFVFSAPSGTGKTTIIKALLNADPELVFSISATTRKKRINEVNGKDYFFLSEEEFKSKIRNNEFIEWENFFGFYYGTLKSFVNEKIENGKSLIMELDVKGALSIKKEYPGSVLIFIAPPGLDILKERLRGRKTETEEELEKRFHRAAMELDYRDKFDYTVINDNLDHAVKQTLKVLEKESVQEK